MDRATQEFFLRQMQEPENQACVDDGTAYPQWASVSHGCYISLDSSGVHRSLGVHVSFVRSITMDSWKPLHLRQMELGGNAKLKAFFRQHDIPDDMPIVEKYNTRAALWYRSNLRALAEGSEPPPPLPEGTGQLPVSGSTSPVAFAGAPAGALMSAGGALASNARQYGGGYHSAAPAERSEPLASGRPAGSSGGGPAASSSATPASGDDFLSGLLGPEVGAKVSTGVWSAVGLVGSLANKAKAAAGSAVSQAQNEGWLESAAAAAKQGVGAAVERTTWAAQKSVEAGKATYTYVNEAGGQEVLGKTTEVLGNTAKRSLSLVGSGADWFTDQLSSLGQGSAAGGLQAMSSGRMQGFGSDCPAPTAVAAAEEVGSSSSSHLSYHLASGPELPVSKPTSRDHEVASTTGVTTALPTPPAPVPAAAQPAPSKPPAKAPDVWNDDEWGDWS